MHSSRTILGKRWSTTCSWNCSKMGSQTFQIVTCVVVLLSSCVGPTQSLIIKENPMRLRILEYSSTDGSLLKVLNSRYSDLVVGEEVEQSSQVVLECSSLMGPLRWIYSGDGVSLNTSKLNLHTSGNL